ncbi:MULTISPECIES: hypothetical protein [Chryseobacterium]|uniref:hypothetical protein n=1 Tax=Chryseobacterium TaxID=59732 RepID=UPI001924CF9D|nr:MULTISPECIES: hypothetical protein [Chryseobacterium]MBL3548634.1 hypothetical protein [Chryseobacterium sp. KMC2]MDC8102564.1 hypothetical protein [Chryseobacterium rhizosphaerae]
MIQIILMLFGLAFPNNNANTVTSDNGGTVLMSITEDPITDGGGNGNGNGGATTGDTGQTPPPYSHP